MAIDQFKDIINHKGYKLDSKDREIFERELKRSLFGTSGTDWTRYGNTDMIEFVLYDSNENQLPQGETGDLVRYIHLDDANINKYFTMNPDPLNKRGKLNNATEYLVDTELLIKEAGYSNGIFKTQITLLNRRAGSEKIPFDKLWIHEVAPSRTEIRVLPVNKDDDTVLADLQERYNVFINDGNFRDDTASFVQQFVENINIQEVLERFLKIKGRVVDGQIYINLIKKEFGIKEWEIFLKKIRSKFIQSMKYYVENRDSNINSLTYGNPLNVRPPVQLSVDEIYRKAINTLIEVIDHILPKRNVLENSTLSIEDQVTFDEVADILDSMTGDGVYDSTIPDSITTVVRGCTDPDSLNFNPSATEDDGSCIYDTPDGDNIGDGSGIVGDDPTDPLIPIDSPVQTVTFYIWSATGSVTYTLPDSRRTRRQRNQTWSGVEYDSRTITFIGDPRIIGDIRTYPKPLISNEDIYCNDPTALNFGEIGLCTYAPVPIDNCIEIDSRGRTRNNCEDNDITEYDPINDILQNPDVISIYSADGIIYNPRTPTSGGGIVSLPISEAGGIDVRNPRILQNEL